MRVGIIGLPNAGKSTIFNALTAGHALTADYPFTTIDPNVGDIAIPDPRIERLAGIYHPQKATHAHIEFVDIAGLVKGASKGEGLGNKFLSHIREVDAVVHVVRLFEEEHVAHPMGSIEPVRDIEIILTELLLADLQSVEKQMQELSGAAKSGDKKAREQVVVMQEIKKGLEQGKPVRQMPVSDDVAKQLFLLTSKPVLYVGNAGEGVLTEQFRKIFEHHAHQEKAEYLILSGKIESEIIQLPDAERDEFRKEMGIEETGLQQLIRKSFSLLNLITFFTGRSVEVRAWPIPKGIKAPQAAGKIHSDMEKGFIKADIFPFEAIDHHGSEAALREKGLIRIEGKDYVMQEGDVAYFRFSS